jgi:hypothetical protein
MFRKPIKPYQPSEAEKARWLRQIEHIGERIDAIRYDSDYYTNEFKQNKVRQMEQEIYTLNRMIQGKVY